MGANLFANIDPALFGAVDAVARLAGLSKKAVLEAMIADRMHIPHHALTRVRGAWTRYRKGERP